MNNLRFKNKSQPTSRVCELTTQVRRKTENLECVYVICMRKGSFGFDLNQIQQISQSQRHKIRSKSGYDWYSSPGSREVQNLFSPTGTTLQSCLACK